MLKETLCKILHPQSCFVFEMPGVVEFWVHTALGEESIVLPKGRHRHTAHSIWLHLTASHLPSAFLSSYFSACIQTYINTNLPSYFSLFSDVSTVHQSALFSFYMGRNEPVDQAQNRLTFSSQLLSNRIFTIVSI